jgi:hypothetical protein
MPAQQNRWSYETKTMKAKTVKPQKKPEPVVKIKDLKPKSDVSGGGPGVYRTTDGGLTWVGVRV